jgi:PPM family protein phosphatase
MQYVAVSALSHDGLAREHNEDSLVAGPWTLCGVVTPNPQTFYFSTAVPLVVAVADGLGGHPAGEEASSLVVRWLAQTGTLLNDPAAIGAALDDCNAAVYAEARLDPARTGMGTTVAGVVVTDEAVHVFNVGDSRVYAVDAAGLVLLTVDDNQSPEPGQRRSSVVTQTLGGSLDMDPVDPHLSSRPNGDAARYLICTDGLTDAVDEPTIAGTLAEYEGSRAVFELWKATIDAGAPDNITVALVEVSDAQPE